MMGPYDHVPWWLRAWARVTYWRLRFFGYWPDWSAWHYFSTGGVGLVLYTPFTSTGLYVRLHNGFRRHMNDGTAQWGIGLLQLGQRHLLYQTWYRDEDGRERWGTCVAFVWLVGRPE